MLYKQIMEFSCLPSLDRERGEMVADLAVQTHTHVSVMFPHLPLTLRQV